MYISFVFLILFVGLFIAGVKRKPTWINTIDKKEHKLFIIYPIIDFLLSRKWIKKQLARKKLPREINILYGNKDSAEIKRIYYCARISPLIMILIICSIFSIFIFNKESKESGSLQGKSLIRPGYGQGDKKVNLLVNIEPSLKDKAKKRFVENYSFDIGEIRYRDGEMEKVFQSAIKYLETTMIGENKSQWEVEEDLVFTQEIPGTSIYVEWFPEDYGLINKKGQIVGTDIPKEGVNTSVTAELTYFDKQVSHKFPIQIFEAEVTEKEHIRKNIEDQIYRNSDASRHKERIQLPIDIEGYKLAWEERKSNSSFKIMVFGIGAAIIAWSLGSRELEERKEKRKAQLLIDYPDIINKFTLLINAGMSLKQAWFRISEDYSKEIELSKDNVRYAYEEIRYTVHELKLGIAEQDAYETFGRRCNILPYLRFSTLLCQNLKKGNRGLTELLKKEAVESLRERKEVVIRQGEEASTKLLIPMMILLLIVLLIVMIPVFISL